MTEKEIQQLQEIKETEEREYLMSNREVVRRKVTEVYIFCMNLLNINFEYSDIEDIDTENRIELLRHFMNDENKTLLTGVIELLNSYLEYHGSVDCYGFVGVFNEIEHEGDAVFGKARKVEQELLLAKIKKNNFLESGQTREENISIPPILWNGSQADLTRIYKALKEAGLINATARDFSKHFLNKKGEPMPEDFTESKKYKQPEYSPNGSVSGLQNAIRGMNPESGE